MKRLFFIDIHGKSEVIKCSQAEALTVGKLVRIVFGKQSVLAEVSVGKIHSGECVMLDAQTFFSPALITPGVIEKLRTTDLQRLERWWRKKHRATEHYAYIVEQIEAVKDTEVIG